MKVMYLGRQSRRRNSLPAGDEDVLELLSDNWDDYSFKTSFPTVCRIRGESFNLGLLRLLIDGHHSSSAHLDRLLEAGWSGEFPIPDTNYVSVPAEIAFYEQLMGLLEADGAIRVATHLRDASYMARVALDAEALAMVETSGFLNSLQRERGSQKAYLDGWKVLESQATAVLDLGFRFHDACDGVSLLNLKFKAENPLPHEVNALIGPNGVGKSRVLHQIVADWVTPSKSKVIGFTEKPNLSQIVVVSYSPFETFPVDLQGKKLQDQDAYRYYGLRGRARTSETKGLGKIQLSHDFSKKTAASALIECLKDDKRYSAIKDWAQKVMTMENVLRSAFSFDFAAVRVPVIIRPRSLYADVDSVEPLFVEMGRGDEKKRFIPVSSDRIASLDDKKLRERVMLREGVVFFSNGKPLRLSSGQRLFSYVVINILGAIRRNSLILIDEPELFLHPTLEIQFLDMLKKILEKFNSKALLATHSEVTVREIPAACVHVFQRTSDGLVIKRPPFQTFGGNVQRISSYVFGDSHALKPFERWLKTQVRELGSGRELIEALGGEINEELLIQIKATERAKWS